MGRGARLAILRSLVVSLSQEFIRNFRFLLLSWARIKQKGSEYWYVEIIASKHQKYRIDLLTPPIFDVSHSQTPDFFSRIYLSLCPLVVREPGCLVKKDGKDILFHKGNLPSSEHILILIFLNSYLLAIGKSGVSEHCAAVCRYARLAVSK